ncbi:NTP transferase domain-containing protein [Varibaculum vaginae]|uniref:NTP transferase domain-containing protein n=1 Tax=Varibaculum vaginae TaxID=2364797 RepID=UPI000F081973|nr:NTP transferase domain-containing protein [Varibaculum vaginae]
MVAGLNEAQFNVLYAFYRCSESQKPSQVQSLTGLPLATLNSTVKELEAWGYLAEQQITVAGKEALAPYAVDNAVIMAAGLSSRFAPISYERPKGMLKVRGEVLIERQIEQLHEAGITDIMVVVGYRKEYFFYLAKKYGVKIVVNPEYASRNNNGSLWLVRDKLANTYVCSSDNYFTENPFESHVYRAYYSAQHVPGETDEWCLQTDSDGLITGVTIGGRDAWIMLGHVYFDREFSRKFVKILENVYHLSETVPKLWEQIYVDHLNTLPMGVRKYPEGVINEFDSVDELRSFDPLFMENVDSEIFENIKKTLGCDVNDIQDIYPLKQGITNLSCHFSVNGSEFVYRHPGVGTDKIMDRQAESEALNLARELGLDSTFLASDPVKGWKISRFIPNCRNLDVSNPGELRRAMRMSRQLHESGKMLTRKFDFVAEGLRYENIFKQYAPIEIPGYEELREKILRLKRHTDADNFPIVPSHNDFSNLNFLVSSEGDLDLIDWEYAGMSDIAADFGTMVVSTVDLNHELADQALEYYFDRPPSLAEHRHFWSHVVFAGWCWYLWSLVKEAEGDNIGEWLYLYYSYATEQINDLLAAYERDPRERY